MFPHWTHLENDQFLHDEQGNYVFTPARRKQAVKSCVAATEEAMKAGNNVVVSNCFLDRRSMDAYYELAGLYNYNLFEKVADGKFNNVHGVPEEMLEIMRKRWED